MPSRELKLALHPFSSVVSTIIPLQMLRMNRISPARSKLNLPVEEIDGLRNEPTLRNLLLLHDAKGCFARSDRFGNRLV